VAMLKKDLATSQRRTAEVIHNYQRSQLVDSMRQQQQQGHSQLPGQQQQQQGVVGASTATAKQQQQQQQQLPPNEIAFVPGTADIDGAAAAAAAAAAAPKSAEKPTTGPQPSPRALNVARDLEQMDKLLNNATAVTTASSTTTKNTPTSGPMGSSSSSGAISRAEPEGMVAVVVASPALVVQTLEKPPIAAETAMPHLAETLVSAVATSAIVPMAAENEEAASAGNNGDGGISPSSYPLSEPVDSDDFEDVYNQADASIPVTTRTTSAVAAVSAASITTTPPMSPSSSKPPLMGKKNVDDDGDDEDDDDNDGEDPSDVVGDTAATRRNSGPGSSSKLVSAFFPHSASPKLGRGGAGGYNEEFPGDITAVTRKPSSTRSRLGRLSGFAEMEDDETSGGILLPSRASMMTAAARAVGGGPQDKSTLSSIDAFEASFRITDFPETFSPRESSSTVSEEKKSSTGEPPYNPFFPSPQKGRPGAEDSTVSSMPVDGIGSSGGTIKSGFVASLVAASAAAQEEQQRDPSLSPTSLQHQQHRFFVESKRSKDPPGRDRTSPRSLMKNNTGVVTNAPKQKSLSFLGKDNSLPPPRGTSLSSPRSSSLLQRRTAAVTPISQQQQQQEQKSPGFATAASAAPPALDMEKFRSPNVFNSKASSSTPTIVTNNSTPATPLSPGRSSPTSEDNGSAKAAVVGVPVEPKRPEKAGYDLARLRYEKAMANRKPRTPNFDNGDNNSTTSSQGTGGKSSSQPRRSSIDSSSHSSNKNDAVSQLPTTPKENKNNANSSTSADAAGGEGSTDGTPPSTILTSPKSSRAATSEAVVSTPPKSQSNNTSTPMSPGKMAIVDGQPVVSVRDRLSLFSDRTPRSPEKEAARLQAVANARRLDLDTSYEDEGDIPLPTSINRKSAAEEIAESSINNNGISSTATTNSGSIGSPTRNNKFPPKRSPSGDSSVSSGGGGSYINGANHNAASTNTSLTRHRPWDSNNNNNNNNNIIGDFDPTADPKISASMTTAADATLFNNGLNSNKPRRSVAHPVSYAEPSLRTKLRKGDVYFPQDEETRSAVPATTAATTTNAAE
jgi:Shugoshin C terminus